MARQSHYISKLSYKDENLLYVLKNSQHISLEQGLLMVTRNRLDAFQKEGVIRKLHYIEDGRQRTAYELTPKGRTFIERHYPAWNPHFYSSPTAIRHNIQLANSVMLHTKSRDWLNEADLRQRTVERIADAGEMRWFYLKQLEEKQLSIPDGGYVNDNGELCLIEIVNSNYGTEEIQLKENTATILNAQITYIRQ